MKRLLLGLSFLLFFASPALSAQHDYVIDNAPGASARADINNVLQAIATNNSSATEPATTFPNMWWFDTSTGLLKRRDNADTTWITVGLEAADTDGTLSANSDSKIATQKATKTYADTKVSKTGNETVAGIKTFSSFPVTPSSAPSTNYEVANKKYVDDELTELPGRSQLFTADGTFTAPAGVTTVFLTMCAAGADGGAAYADSGDTNNHSGAGGSGGGASLIKYPYTVTPAGNYAVDVGTTSGASTSFNSDITVPGGSVGSQAGTNGTTGGLGGGSPEAMTAVAATAGVPYFAGGNGAGVAIGGGWGGGAGGASRFGKGGTPGTPASGYGAGGFGGSYSPWPTATPAGTGTKGFALVEW
jgi:hypothetical protein